MNSTQRSTFKSVEDLQEELGRLKKETTEKDKAYKITLSRMEIKNNKIMKILNTDPQKLAMYSKANQEAQDRYEEENKKASALRYLLFPLFL